MRISNLPLLKKLVETTFEKKVLSFKECAELSESIFIKTDALISVNTLRRFFGLVKCDYLPSYSTLNVLAKYCGFDSFSQLLNVKECQQDAPVNSELLSYIVSVFKETMVTSVNDPTYLDLVRVTILFLNQNPHLVNAFQKEIAKTKNGQDFYYEQFINLDKLNGYYGDGLKHYLAQKKTNEAQIFGHGLLAFRYWLTKQPVLFTRHYDEIQKFEVEPTMHPFATGRFWGVAVLKAHHKKQDLTKLLQQVRTFFELSKIYRHKYVFPYFEYSFALPLVLTEQWEETLFYAEEGMERKKNIDFFLIHHQLFQYLCLFKAMALTAIGEKQKGQIEYHQIDPDKFYFVSKKFYTILYILLSRSLGKIGAEDGDLENLIADTGFVQLVDLFKSSRKPG